VGLDGKPVTRRSSRCLGIVVWRYSDDPVNAATGNFTQSEPVLDFPVPWSANVSLAYNSRDARPGPFGGVVSSLTESVTENRTVRPVCVGRRGDGGLWLDGDGAYSRRWAWSGADPRVGRVDDRPAGRLGEFVRQCGPVLSFRDPTVAS